MTTDKHNNKKIETTKVGWEDTVVMICTKCAKQFSDPILNDAPERIKSELKSKARSELGGSVRVITTSCLNICPVDKIAIAKASTLLPSVFKGYTVDPNVSGEELYETILKK